MVGKIESCPLVDAMQVLSGRWRLVIVYCLLDGPKRFSDLQRDIPKISRRMLTFDLKKLEERRVVSRTVYAEVPTRVEYELTDKGFGLRPVIDHLAQWGLSIGNRTPKVATSQPNPSIAE